MKIALSIAGTAAVMLHAAGTSAADPPTFELKGFPITPVQLQLVGPAHV